MKTFTKLAIALSLPLVAMGASAAPVSVKGKSLPDISKMRYQARNYKTLFNSEKAEQVERIGRRMAAVTKTSGPSKTPDFSLPATDQYEYLDGPNGSIYLCSSEFEIEEVTMESYVEKKIVGFKFTVYDSDFNMVGEIKDKVKLDTTTNPENPEIRVASLGLSPVITKKFFNFDDKFEVMVYFNMNTPDYTVNSRSVAYQLGGQKDEEGNDIPLCTINGNLSDVLEASTSKWSEDFYLTFASDYVFPLEDPDDDSYTAFLNSQGVIIETYKKVTYGSTTPEKFFEYKMHLNDWPGDQENATPFISRNIDGKPYFIINGYTDGLFLFEESDDDFGFGEQVWNENTDFFVDIYQPTSLDNPNLVQHTEIDVKKSPGDNILATFYFLGSLGYRDDINFDYCDEDGKANLVITTKDWDGAEMGSTSSYYLYKPDGSLETNIAENVDGVLAMSDIDGQEPEYMFVIFDNGEYNFEFINPFNAVTHHSFKQLLLWQDDFEGLYVNADRVPDGDSYKYCFELSTPGLDENGNDLMRIAWVNTDGEITEVDEVNMGKNIRMAKVYIGQEVLSPYTFDTTPEREYMIIVKRGTEFSSVTQEEFLVSTAASKENPVGKIHLAVTPDKTLGNLTMVTVLNTENSPILWVMYYNNDTGKYAQQFYHLPFSKFAGGDGSAENPYKIATAGDLQCMRDNLNAHYEIVSDMDAAGVEFSTIASSNAPFTGTLNGNGHTISNLTISGKDSYSAIFAYIDQATISGITFVNPTVKVANSKFNALIAATSQRSTLSDIHVVGMSVSADAECSFGSLVGMATLNTVVSDCSVNANIDMPEATPVGGIVGESRTGASVLASAFSGSIKAKSVVGGILGTASSNAGAVADCHVDADVEAQNVVGGIVGEIDQRILVDRCYVEGNLKATKTFGTRIVNKGYAAGGIAGMISTFYANNYASDGTTAAAANDVITNCFVNLESISTPELPAGHQNSVHRIAGFTSINDLQPDWDNITDGSNIDKFLPTEAELGIKNNFAVASLAKVDSSVDADVTTTEGKDVDASDLNGEFFASLGFKTGTTTDAPWNETPENDPSLFHEFGAKFVHAEITAEENQAFDAELMIVSRQPVTAEEFADGFAGEIADESVVEMNGNLTVNNNVASIGFNALKVGKTEFTANVNGSLAKVTFNILPANSAIEEVGDSACSLVITFNGTVVSAPGASLEVYSLDGKKVATGRESLSLASLANGFYIVKAHDASGNKAVRKFLLQ